jgi:predicted amidohydrolase YtcJ
VTEATTDPIKVSAEKIFHGGPILTMNDERPQVEAIAIAGGRIVAVGDEAEVRETADESTEIIDLGGNTLMPSFIDAHGHLMNAPQVLDWANVSGVPAGPVTCIADIITELKAHVTRLGITPGDDNWIIAYGYDRTNLSEGREVTRYDLDPDFPDNPVMLIHSSNHGAVLNSKAFENSLVGYDENKPTPDGGLIVRTGDKKGLYGTPEGLIMETAFLPVFGKMPQPSEDELLGKLDRAQQIYASVGVTTCQEGATHARDLKFLRKAADNQLFYLDIVSLPMALEIPNFIKEYFPSTSIDPGFNLPSIPDEAAEYFGTYNNRLKLAGMKLHVDGSPQGKTAFWTEKLLTPGPGGEDNWRGQPLFPPEQVNPLVKEIYDKGIQIFCHCNGDAAIDMMIDAARAAGVTAADDRRTVIIHSQCMRREALDGKPTQLDSYLELGFSPSFFTAHTFFWGTAHMENLGNHRASFISPMNSAIAKGLHCSNHNDFSVTPMDPMMMVWSAVARESREVDGITHIVGKDERITPWQALQALTIEAAWQIREEDIKGTLDVGKLADLVILDGNPTTVPTDDILKIKALKTFKEGSIVYSLAQTLPDSSQ